MPTSLLDRRKAVAGAFVALLMLLTVFAGQGLSPRSAEAATLTYQASEVCDAGVLTIPANVGDVVRFEDAFLGPCDLLNDYNWYEVWSISWYESGGIWILDVTITSAGTVTTSPWGESASATIVATAAAAVPHAPQNVTAIAGDGQATVSFSPPANDGGSAITGYTVTSSPGNITATGASSPITVTGLTNGNLYTFTVTATNSVGVGNPSSPSNAVIPAGAPTPPQNLGALPGNAQATIYFSPPANDGGSAVTGYTITSSPGGITATGTSSPITVTGLTNGTEYTFTMTATNVIGTSDASTPSNVATPMGLPGAPQNVSATAGNGQATVSFDPPASDGGSAITGYTVTSNPGGFTGTGANGPITVTGLTNGITYTFTVAATNSVGTGPASTASNGVTPANVPGAPQNVSATAGNTQATVSFDAPASNGGSAITGYTVTSNPGGFTGTGANSPMVVSGLTNGTEYTFTVTATNSAGTSAASSASNAVIPATIPGWPNNVTAVAGDGQATVSFDAPASNGGSAITGYTVTASPGDHQVTGTESPITVTGLNNGTKYLFTVTATNSAGTSEESGADFATPLGAPGAPTHVVATAGNGQATVSFDAPNDNGGSAITGYNVVATPGGKSATGVHSPITVEGLENGVAYTFTVVATNAIGTGEPSGASNAVTPQGGTHITLNSSPGTSVFGNGFALVANVSGEGTPTGTVTFFRGDNEIGSVALDANGDATLAVDGYAVGTHNFRAVYSGSAAYESAESNIATHTVAKAPSTIDLTVSHSHLLVGETITLTATVPMDVTGTVTFTTGNETLGTATIIDGVATIEALFAVAGGQDVVATSSGDSSYLGATDSLTVTVHTVAAEDTTPPTGTETPVPGATPDPTETPEAPTTPETPDNEPGEEPTNEPNTGLVEPAPVGTTVIKVSNPGAFKVGDVVVINQGTPNEERRTIVAIDEHGIVLNAGLDFTHEAGVSVVLLAGSQPVVPPATDPTAQPGAPLPPNSGSGLRIIETGPLFALPLVLAVLLLASGALAHGTRKQS